MRLPKISPLESPSTVVGQRHARLKEQSRQFLTMSFPQATVIRTRSHPDISTTPATAPRVIELSEQAVMVTYDSGHKTYDDDLQQDDMVREGSDPGLGVRSSSRFSVLIIESVESRRTFFDKVPLKPSRIRRKKTVEVELSKISGFMTEPAVTDSIWRTGCLGLRIKMCSLLGWSHVS
jgi:hypothetical protein